MSFKPVMSFLNSFSMKAQHLKTFFNYVFHVIFIACLFCIPFPIESTKTASIST